MKSRLEGISESDGNNEMLTERWSLGSVGVLVILMGVGAAPAEAQEPWDAAERQIRRLPADSFPGLPDEVRSEMRRLDCAVPQGSDLQHPHNILMGSFADVSQNDWAFLCSRDGTSSIHLLWGGVERCDSPIGHAEDRSYLQGLGGDSIGFSRRLLAIDRDGMLSRARAFGGPPVPAVWHHGIEDYFEGKASRVLLCVGGKWLELQGVD